MLPWCNTEAMTLHLAEISARVAPERHAALLVDQAGWHLSERLVVPANITIVLLPAKCPELNPQENVWQFMRDNWLSNRVFTSYTDIVDHCCYAWNKLVEQPWTIMSEPTKLKFQSSLPSKALLTGHPIGHPAPCFLRLT